LFWKSAEQEEEATVLPQLAAVLNAETQLQLGIQSEAAKVRHTAVVFRIGALLGNQAQNLAACVDDKWRRDAYDHGCLHFITIHYMLHSTRSGKPHSGATSV
jgi:hypothetical protein